jgi:hypothetical protein
MAVKNTWNDGDSFAASDANAVATAINAFGTAPSTAVVGINDTQVLQNKEIVPRVGTTASTATPSISVDSYDQYNITALAVAITSVTITGTAVDGQKLMIRIKDNGTARAIAWGTTYFSNSGSGTMPTTTVATKTHLVYFIYDSVLTKWVCMASDQAGY